MALACLIVSSVEEIWREWENIADMGRPRKPIDVIAVRCAIGKRIRAARVEAGLSQVEVAQASGYTAANPISKIENGDVVHLDIARLAAIARVCNVELLWLVEPAVRAVDGRFRPSSS